MGGATALRVVPVPCRPERWDTGRLLPARDFAEVRRSMVLDHCKWDPQVGDVATLAPFPIVLPADEWRTLARLAEALAAEAQAAEAALLERPQLLARLGLPAPYRRILADASQPPTPAAARVVRFDFHPTPDGWRISEANADVPGGYTEAAAFARLMARHVPGARPAGDPAAALVEALIDAAGPAPCVGLLAASGFMEDQQITAYLEALLRRRGCRTHRAHPRQVHWIDERAHLDMGAGAEPLDALIRFYQGEWLARLPRDCGWPRFVRGGRTPVANPGTALVVESKRFPLVWDDLPVGLDTWRRLLPATRDPRDAPWRRDPSWLLKTALCNTGDAVAMPGLDRRRWRGAAVSARWNPGGWVAQRRFEALPIATPLGPHYPCLGVYTVDGRAAGIYGRLAARPLIDYAARDVAVLVADPATGTE